jgi:hypothetical protein
LLTAGFEYCIHGKKLRCENGPAKG